MGFLPIDHTQKFIYTLWAKTDTWGLCIQSTETGKEVNVDCPLVEQASQLTSYMCDRSYLGEKIVETLVPLSLDERTTVYIDPKSISDYAQKVFDIIKLESELDEWALKPELSKSQQIKRAKAKKKIIEYNSHANSNVLEARKAFDVCKLKFELEDWVAETGLTDSEKTGRLEAKKRILNCILNFEKELNLSSLHLSRLPENLGALRDLTILRISNNNITSLPAGFKNFALLESLQANGNKLSCIFDDIGMLKSLQDLNLEGNQITLLPKSFVDLPRLTILNLAKNKLELLPKNFGQLKGLTELRLSSNAIRKLPETFIQLDVLTYLDLSSNQLELLPVAFEFLFKLKNLILRDNQITGLPEGFHKLTDLVYLDLAGNNLHSLNYSNFGNLRILKVLKLENNYLESLPEDIGQLALLEELNLGGNELSELPYTFSNLINLQRLDMSFNEFRALPDIFAGLGSLTRLNLSGNFLEELPDGMEDLSNLIELDLASNQFATFPEWITDLPEIQSVDVIDNPYISLPQELALLSPDLNTSFNALLAKLYNFITPDERSSFQFNDSDLKVTDSINLWLKRLFKSADFVESSEEIQGQIAKFVLTVLKQASQDQELKESLDAFLLIANSSCTDRITLSLIELEILMQFKITTKSLQDRKMGLNLLKGMWITHLLSEMAKNWLEEHNLNGEIDEIEVILAHYITGKKICQNCLFPFSSESMRYSEKKLNTEQLVEEIQDLNTRTSNRWNDFVEFLYLGGNEIADDSLRFFKNLFQDEIAEEQKKVQDAQEIIEGIFREDLDSEKLQERISDLHPDLKEILSSSMEREPKIEAVYERLDLWNKQLYQNVIENYLSESGKRGSVQ